MVRDMVFPDLEPEKWAGTPVFLVLVLCIKSLGICSDFCWTHTGKLLSAIVPPPYLQDIVIVPLGATKSEFLRLWSCCMLAPEREHGIRKILKWIYAAQQDPPFAHAGFPMGESQKGYSLDSVSLTGKREDYEDKKHPSHDGELGGLPEGKTLELASTRSLLSPPGMKNATLYANGLCTLYTGVKVFACTLLAYKRYFWA